MGRDFDIRAARYKGIKQTVKLTTVEAMRKAFDKARAVGSGSRVVTNRQTGVAHTVTCAIKPSPRPRTSSWRRSAPPPLAVTGAAEVPKEGHRGGR